jgi:BioD-like phosphotransacetylase family protein
LSAEYEIVPTRGDKPVMSVEDQCRMFARMLVEMTDRLHQQDHRIAELMQRVAGLESDVALLGMAANMTRHGSDRE